MKIIYPEDENEDKAKRKKDTENYMKDSKKLEMNFDRLILRFAAYQRRSFFVKTPGFWGKIDTFCSWTLFLPSGLISVKYPRFVIPMIVLNCLVLFTGGIGWVILTVVALLAMCMKVKG